MATDASASGAWSTTMQTAAVLLYDGCTIAECIEAATRLANNDVDVSWISSEGQSVVDQSGLRLEPTRLGSDVVWSTIDALLIPGGDPGSIIGDELIRSWVRQVADGGTVAAICAGVLVVADAGVLAGRRATHNYRSPWAPTQVEQHVAHLFADVDVEPDRAQGVVVDGNLITALPNATAAFSIAVCVALGICSDEHAARLTRHLQGMYVPAIFERSENP